MATETVTNPHSTLTQLQIDKCTVAAHEIQLVVKALQTYIEAEDEHGTIFPVSKTMLKRITSLTDAIGWVIEPQQHTDGGVDGLERASVCLAEG